MQTLTFTTTEAGRGPGAGPTPALDLAVEDLESLDAPSWWEYALGFAAGLGAGAIIFT